MSTPRELARREVLTAAESMRSAVRVLRSSAAPQPSGAARELYAAEELSRLLDTLAERLGR